MSRWTTDEIELLIQNVESKPCLYNLQSSKYKDKRFNEAAWQTIGNILNKTGQQCKEKWTVLRTQKRNIYNNAKKTKSGSSKTTSIKWEYNKMLSFLEPHFGTGNQTSSIENKENECTEVEVVEVQVEKEPSFVLMDEPDFEKPSVKIDVTPKQKKRKHQDTPVMDEIDQMLIDHLNEKKKQPVDTNCHFLQELGNNLSSLSKISQIKTKMEIQQLVYKKLLGETEDIMEN